MARWGVIFSCAVASMIACRGIVGIDDTPPTKLACGSLLQGACQTCGVASCCAELDACAKSPACHGLETCLAACTDAACRAQCTLDHPSNGDPTVVAIASCLASSCEQACGAPACGWYADFMPPEVANACETCIANKACAPVGACIANRDCLGIAECVDTNTTPDRIAACASDAGLPLWNPATQALATCTDECGIHENWTCVGHVVWSKAESVPIKVRVHVIDGTSFAGIGGVTVKLCEVTDTSCVNPSDTETSDTDGYVTMTVKQLLGPFGPTGYFDVSGASVYPELVFWSFPLSVASQTGTVPTISVNAFNAFETLFNVPSDDTRGHVFAAAYDCRANPASNVQFKIDSQDPEIKTLYVQGASFSAMATSTDRSGLAGFFDVPKGGLTLTETPVGTNLSSSVSFFVRPMTLSAVYVLPQPP